MRNHRMVSPRFAHFVRLVPVLLGLSLLASCAVARPPANPFVGTWYDIFFESYAEPATREQFRLRADGTGEYYFRPFMKPREWVPIRWRQVAPGKIEFLGMPGKWVASATLNEKGQLSYRVDRGNGSNGIGLFSKDPNPQ